MRSLVFVLAAALVVAAASGCADDDGTAGGSTATTPAATVGAGTSVEAEPRPGPAKDQSRWAKQVDAACKPLQERIDAVPPPVDGPGLERWLAELLPLARQQLAAVKATKPPAKQSEAERAALFTASLTRLERGLTRYLAAIRANDPEAVQQALAETGAAGAAARSHALSLGITECGGYGSG